ncbi:peptidyl-tRNA hydrolase ICT1, mitochondrial isoform X2 [Esox lucius]|uniref:peptidyl-tRNA hydrolase ICT1, mitochondrial isoform X2 n=1 Tax=Esox lucius TaxID=8010 RepID=UPI0005767139|nr:peptidyl-tRNA hydrolase ICT1, mitochondrial isoform X2 [Esox lucius]
MATSTARCVFALPRMIPYITLHIKLPPLCRGQINLYSRCPSNFYGNRASDNLKDGHVNIPVVSYSRSSGPGGQHVNKVNTKAEARFHIYTADWIPEDVRQNIILKNKKRINKAGELLVTSERSRSQMKNLNDCIQKISDIIAEASVKPHEPSAEDIALRASSVVCVFFRLEKRNKERLEQKKLHSALKRTRQVEFD